jgi:hypothetical protein
MYGRASKGIDMSMGMVEGASQTVWVPVSTLLHPPLKFS